MEQKEAEKLLCEYINKLTPLTDHQWKYLVSHFEYKYYNADEVIVPQGAVYDAYYLVVDGVLRLHAELNSKDTTIYLLQGAEAMADFKSMCHKTPTRYNLTTTTPSAVFIIKATDFEELYQQDDLFERLGRRMMETIYANGTKRMHEFIFSSPEETYLKMMKVSPSVVQKVAQKYIASYLNITPQSFSRLKNRMFKK